MARPIARSTSKPTSKQGRGGGGAQLSEPDKPWLFRTYAGHSTAAKSNELYRKNLAKGQTGLSIAFDLPTQTGYDSDHELARGEVGKVGVPVSHLGDMRTLLDGIPLDEMNTSMTINATAAWLLALYVATADEQGAPREKLTGTIQNDIIKEYLSRGTYVFPPEPSLRLIKDTIVFSRSAMPKWNPTNVCSYHLQEAGATPVQELAFALATAQAVLDAVKASGEIAPDDFGAIVGRISFFVNAGLRFVTEMCKMRAFVELWDEITTERYGVTDPKHRLFRYGVQVNSLGLTEQQPENNVYRILIEMLAVTLSKRRARARRAAARLERGAGPAAPLGPAVVAPHAADPGLRDRPPRVSPTSSTAPRSSRRKVDELKAAAKEELARIDEMGGAVAAIDYMKRALVESNTERLRRIETGEQIVVGVNRWTETEPRPCRPAKARSCRSMPAIEAEQVERLKAWRAARDDKAARRRSPSSSAPPGRAATSWSRRSPAPRPASPRASGAPRCVHVFGEYRAPTGVSAAWRAAEGSRPREVRGEVERVSARLGRRIKLLVGKPGLDGHSNGAEQIAVRARDCGMEVVYEGIRLTPGADRARRARRGACTWWACRSSRAATCRWCATSWSACARRASTTFRWSWAASSRPRTPPTLKALGVAAVYTPKNFELNEIMRDIVRLVDGHAEAA